MNQVDGFILLLFNGDVSITCSHLEHRAPLKRFVSLWFLNLRQLAGLLRRGISPSQGRYLTQTVFRLRCEPEPFISISSGEKAHSGSDVSDPNVTQLLLPPARSQRWGGT
jgi:hypothetical protein